MIDWKHIYKLAYFTQKGKFPTKDVKPSSEWKKTMLLAEHSPIRWADIIQGLEVPSFVQNHLVRHHVGVDFLVHSSRPDIDSGKVPRDQQKKTDLCKMMVKTNLNALISISRKRLCRRAETETREVWQALVDAFKESEPELHSVCVPECVYRGFCPEGKRSCGFAMTQMFEKLLVEYRSMPQ